MSWSTRRKLLYLLVALLILAGSTSYFVYPVFKETPTCTDSKQNSNESGVDCGGSCTNLCLMEVRPISILWSRAFIVAPGIYDVLGYVQNQNVDAGIPSLLYRFKLYDDQNVLVAERDGKTYLGPNQTSAIFESQIKTGERVPKHVFLEFEEGYQWVKTNPRFKGITLSVKNKNLENLSLAPRLSSAVENDSLFDLAEIEVTAILRGADENALAISGTQIGNLSKRRSQDVFFTWLAPFSSSTPVSRIEIIPRVNPFTVSY